jgi:hypothetical protein
MDRSTWVSLILIAGCFCATGFTLDIANRQLNYAKAHPVIVTRTVYRYVYKRADDVNAMWLKAGAYCRGDSGASALVLFHNLPVNWETICGGGHEAWTDGGVRYVAPK